MEGVRIKLEETVNEVKTKMKNRKKRNIHELK